MPNQSPQTYPDLCPECGGKMFVTCTKRRGFYIVRFRSCIDPQCHGTGRGLEQLDNPPPKNLCRAIKRSRARRMVAAGNPV